jgi:hypothetical protein
LVVTIIGAHLVNPSGPEGAGPRNWSQLMIFPLGVCAGYLIAWWSPLLGGLIAAACLITSWRLFAVGTPMWGDTILFTSPALLFLLYGLLTMRQKPGRPGKDRAAGRIEGGE